MAFKLSELFVELSAKGFTKVEAGIGRIKGSLLELSRASGIAGALSLTGLTIALYKSITAADDADKSQRRLRATLALVGDQTGVTVEYINSLSESLAKVSEFDDDSIAKASATMLEFGNISKSTFGEAIPIAVNLAARNGDLEGSFRAVGAALSDPAQNLALLRRQFRALSPEVLKAAEDMAKAGDVIGAQRAIMDELKAKTSGMAEAMATDMDKAKVAVGELAETMGKKLAPAVNTVARELDALIQNKRGGTRTTEFFRSLNMLLHGDISPASRRQKLLDIRAMEDEVEKAKGRAARGAKRVGETPEQLAEQKAQEEAVNRNFLNEKRVSTEKERQEILQSLTIAGLDKETAARANVVKQLDAQLEKLKQQFPIQEEITRAEELRSKAIAAFDVGRRRETMEKMIEAGENQRDQRLGLFRDLMQGSAPDKLRHRLEVEFKSSDLYKQIKDAFPEGDLRDSLLGMTDQMRELQQQQITQATKKAPEFVGITEMANRIQQAVGGTGREQLEKQQADLLKKIQAKADGAGLNVNIRNIAELQGLGSVGA